MPEIAAIQLRPTPRHTIVQRGLNSTHHQSHFASTKGPFIKNDRYAGRTLIIPASTIRQEATTPQALFDFVQDLKLRGSFSAIQLTKSAIPGGNDQAKADWAHQLGNIFFGRRFYPATHAATVNGFNRQTTQVYQYQIISIRPAKMGRFHWFPEGKIETFAFRKQFIYSEGTSLNNNLLTRALTKLQDPDGPNAQRFIIPLSLLMISVHSSMPLIMKRDNP